MKHKLQTNQPVKLSKPLTFKKQKRNGLVYENEHGQELTITMKGGFVFPCVFGA